MIRLLVILALVLVSLVALDGVLAARAEEARARSLLVGRLVPLEAQQDMVIAGLAVRVPGMQDEIVFGRSQGVWVARNHHDAFADGPRIVELVSTLLAAQGVVRTRSSEQLAAYGFDEDTEIVARLLDTSLAPVRTFRLGLSPPGAVDGCFARLDDEDAVYALDVNPRRIVLEGVRPGRPPLLDPYVIPRAEPSPWGMPHEVRFLGHPDGVRALVRGPDAGAPDGAAREPPGWTAEDAAGASHPLGLVQAYHYVNFLRGLEALRQYEADETSFPWRGLTEQSPRLGLAFEDAPAVELLFGGRAPEGGVFVLNVTTSRLYAIDEALVPLLFPSVDDLLPSEEPTTLWEPYLR